MVQVHLGTTGCLQEEAGVREGEAEEGGRGGRQTSARKAQAVPLAVKVKEATSRRAKGPAREEEAGGAAPGDRGREQGWEQNDLSRAAEKPRASSLPEQSPWIWPRQKPRPPKKPRLQQPRPPQKPRPCLPSQESPRLSAQWHSRRDPLPCSRRHVTRPGQSQLPQSTQGWSHDPIQPVKVRTVFFLFFLESSGKIGFVLVLVAPAAAAELEGVGLPICSL